MRLKQNVGPADRLARVVGGVALAVLARPPLVKAMGIYWALEGVLGYCLWYDLMNISSIPGEQGQSREDDFPIPREAGTDAGVLSFSRERVESG
ncbi:YgaP family membrane protein [Desulfofundulus sp.]|uniref:YgaP family membrane protein n=1 Tax=Desulfofundulus sp. TaxID=2282750 RepID=UPI003C778FD3